MPDPWWISLIKAAVIVNLVMVAFAYTTWLERKLLGRFQHRYGPNRVGPFGVLQPMADIGKLLFKQQFGDPETMQLKAGHAKLAAYFNMDNGTGAIRGVYLQGNEAVGEVEHPQRFA